MRGFVAHAGLVMGLLGCGGAPAVPPPPQQAATRTDAEPATGSAPVLLAAGGNYTCGSRDGRVYCWGGGLHAPELVRGVRDPIALAAGYRNVCAVTRRGEVLCWPAPETDYYGEQRSTLDATPVEGISGVRSLAMGTYYGACGLTDDARVSCWANGESARLNWTVLDGVVRLTGARGRLCAVLEGGQATCWSEDTPSGHSIEPVVGLNDATSVLDAGDFACAIRRSGRVICWGEGVERAIPGASEDRQERPRRRRRSRRSDAPEFREICGIDGAVELAMGSSDSYYERPVICVRRASGRVTCWGDNSQGQLGAGSTDDCSDLGHVEAVEDAQALTVGSAHACAGLADGRVLCWGNDEQGQLGGDQEEGRVELVEVPGIEDAVEIHRADQYTTCVRRASGSVTCWGADRGRVDQGPRDVRGVAGATALTMFDSLLCARLSTGELRCRPRYGSEQWEPVTLAAALRGVIALDSEDGRVYGMMSDGRLLCAGCPQRKRRTRDALVRIAQVPDGSSIAAGSYGDVCVQLQDRGVRCWRIDERGRITSSDIELGGTVRSIIRRPGDDSYIALRSDGVLASWESYEIGRESVIQAVPRDSFPGSVDVAEGGSHRCGLTATGQVFCRGRNERGQCGAPASRSVDDSREVPGLSNARQLSLGENHSCALRGDGHVVCWGDNTQGQLGRTGEVQGGAASEVAGFGPERHDHE